MGFEHTPYSKYDCIWPVWLQLWTLLYKSKEGHEAEEFQIAVDGLCLSGPLLLSLAATYEWFLSVRRSAHLQLEIECVGYHRQMDDFLRIALISFEGSQLGSAVDWIYQLDRWASSLFRSRDFSAVRCFCGLPHRVQANDTKCTVIYDSITRYSPSGHHFQSMMMNALDSMDWIADQGRYCSERFRSTCLETLIWIVDLDVLLACGALEEWRH